MKRLSGGRRLISAGVSGFVFKGVISAPLLFAPIANQAVSLLDNGNTTYDPATAMAASSRASKESAITNACMARNGYLAQ